MVQIKQAPQLPIVKGLLDNSSSPDIASDTNQSASKLPILSTLKSQHLGSDIDKMKQAPTTAEKSRKDLSFELDKATLQAQ